MAKKKVLSPAKDKTKSKPTFGGKMTGKGKGSATAKKSRNHKALMIAGINPDNTGASVASKRPMKKEKMLGKKFAKGSQIRAEGKKMKKKA